MQAIDTKELFTEVTAEDSATISGGGPVSYLNYSLLATTPASPAGTTINEGEIQDGWNILINAGYPVNGFPST